MGQWQEGVECSSESCENDEYVIGPFQWTIAEGGNDHWYAIVVPSQSICWSDANTRAQSLGGYLLSVTTDSEYAWWLSTFNGTGEEPFIGLRQQQGAGEPADGWEWTTGEGVTFDAWSSGAPSDDMGDKDVAQMLQSGGWADVISCDGPSYAVEFGQWYNVCDTCEYLTIQEAVDDASDVETIFVGEGTYRTVDGVSLVDLQGKDISLIGAGSDVTILDGELSVSGLRFEYGQGGDARMEGLTIRYCVGGDGASVVVDGGQLTIASCVLENNRANDGNANGGACFVSGGATLLLQSCTLESNTADQFGGAIYVQGNASSVEMYDCVCSLNTASSGGAVYVSNNTTIAVEDSEFSNNTASFDGGAMSVNENGSSISFCCFKENNVGSYGGALDNQDGANTIVSNCLFADNVSAFGGGGIYNLNSNPIIVTCTFATNSSLEENGGAIHNDGTSFPSIETSLFSGNTGNFSDDSILEGHIFPTKADADYEFVGGNEFHALCSTCQGDVNGDGVLDLSDLIGIAIVMTWGECNDCLEDLDGNGVVDPEDLIAFVELLSARLDQPCTVECPYR